MAILFAVVSRGTTILSQHANCVGNFQEVIEQVLAKISPENAKFTYSHARLEPFAPVVSFEHSYNVQLFISVIIFIFLFQFALYFCSH